MYRRLKATKDTYITNKIIRNSFRATDANVGEGATLDLFKLYNENKIEGDDTPIELTRILIKFDLNPLRALTGSILDINSTSFRCDLKLRDVFGGQTLPSNFKVAVFPLSRSFDEGVGRDVVKFQDIDSSNFITSSVTNESPTTWHLTGANKQGLLGSSDLDIISSGNLSDGEGLSFLFSEQTFLDGTEDLSVDVTRVISATLANQIPDHGFRISFSGTQETDTKTRFVKRFASRHNSNTRKRPSIDVRYDDTIQDFHEAFFFNLSGSIFLNNFERGHAANVLSGAALTEISGENCMLVKLQTGSFQKIVTASQHSYPGGSLFSTGIYSASFAIDSFGSSSVDDNNTLEDFIRDSGSVTFTTFWQSIDETVGYHTGSLRVLAPDTSTFDNDPLRYTLNVTNIKGSYKPGQQVRLRLVAFDSDDQVKSVKLPLYRPSIVLTKCFYRVRDAYSDDVIIPFDDDEGFNGTLMSTDSKGMYFDIFTDDLDPGRVFTIDVKIKRDNSTQVFKNVGGNFRIDT
tara:strand:- start:4150 stop:5700 length:1551 start_codon:yes stop_codon:yes gene_type:complete